MDTFKFLQKINSLAEKGVPEAEVVELYEEAESLFKDFDGEIGDLKKELAEVQDELKEAKDEVESCEDRIIELEGETTYTLEGHHANIVTQKIMDDLFQNLDRIPMNELSQLIDNHKL